MLLKKSMQDLSYNISSTVSVFSGICLAITAKLMQDIRWKWIRTIEAESSFNTLLWLNYSAKPLFASWSLLIISFTRNIYYIGFDLYALDIGTILISYLSISPFIWTCGESWVLLLDCAGHGFGVCS